MYGLGESFDYIECPKCGCLQIKETPKDMNKYYPNEDYYSFDINGNSSSLGSLIKKIINKRDEYCILKNSLFGKLVNFKYPNSYFSILGDLNLSQNSRILDVGCGSGKFLYQLKKLDFKELTGIDLYLEKETHIKNLKILKKNIHQMLDDQKFDLIIFSHSFEHLEDPVKTLKKVKNILSDDGTVIIRIPVKTTNIWNIYGVNWTQIDAPRHFFIYTSKSFEILLEKTDFNLEKVVFDSTEFQFWGSEQHKREIPLKASNSYEKNPKKSIFSKKQINEYKKQSEMLNNENCGDQATFIIKKNEY
jgi:SAM-dependent methyltransferase